MSRVGKYPIRIPSGVEAFLVGQLLTIKGVKGEAQLRLVSFVEVIIGDQQISVSPAGVDRQCRNMWGTTRACIANMIIGVSVGFRKALEINGTGYRVALKEGSLLLNLGFSHEVIYQLPNGIRISTPKPTSVVIEGVDRQQVGQVAAELRSYRPPEAYKGKGIRYEGEVIRQKEGKKK